MTSMWKPFEIGSLKLKNRVVMAPMTRCFSPEGIPNPDVAAYYRRRAENEVGLIITEGVLIDHEVAGAEHDVPHLFGEKALQEWAHIVEEVHKVGGKIAPQIWHTGMARDPNKFPLSNAKPVGPSGINYEGKPSSEPLSIDEIDQIIKKYAEAAENAKNLGFDAVEIHGAHGYLIDQFFAESFNKRTDEYGGDLVQRTRFAVKVIKAVRAATAPDFPIIFRFSQWKLNDYDYKLANSPEELKSFLVPLVEAGVDIFHASTRRFWEAEFEGSNLNLAAWTKKITGKPVISVGSVGLTAQLTKNIDETEENDTTAHLEELWNKLDKEDFDLIAIGRALIGDPAWVTKIKNGKEKEVQVFKKKDLSTLF
ncbi:NADH:flavin oxidoreductase [Paenibacillus xylanilyticus]|uniref:NADH:flavin oxidoreductase n=1 Tax=Paenibacillus xylanilyticus TaxID=248903 RepID=A0A7Y6BUE0_9BACL|nr:NADH:flavin oxidoreductase [Paenibacillus xylanilyticus]NUU74345.1 NADH:flavin oxidoreductase [Paenibacillus xylanilyticus]